jgi:hypothetical protein
MLTDGALLAPSPSLGPGSLGVARGGAVLRGRTSGRGDRRVPEPDALQAPWIEAVEVTPGSAPPALDWQVRWSPEGGAFGYWVADAEGASWGRLTVLRISSASGRIDRGATLLGPTLARRSFTLGADRVAWVAPADDGPDEELRVRTWGAPGENDLRIRDLRLRDAIPAF